MTTDYLTYYTNQIRSVRRSTVDKKPAPHKPLLLLSIIDLIEKINLQENRIPINITLKSIFEENLNKLYKTEKNILMKTPIHHLQTDGFWKAFDKDGEQLKSSRAISQVSFGTLDAPLFQLIKSPVYRPVLRMFLLDTFFDGTQQNYLTEKPLPNYLIEIENNFVAEPPSEYREHNRIISGFVRNHKFRKNLLPLYDFTCCMSGMKTTPDIGLIEACHIEDHAFAGNNALTNGIPLCKNLHQAFDSGIISIDDNYQILLKKEQDFKEVISLYGIRQLEQQRIKLPMDEQYYPSLKKLYAHRKRFQFC